MSSVLYAVVAMSALYSATCFQPPSSIAVIGFPIGLLFTLATLVVSMRFLSAPNRNRLAPIRKMFEYLPFVLFASFVISRTGPVDGQFLLDLASVLLWIAASVLSVVVLYRLSDKRIGMRYPSLTEAAPSRKTVVTHTFEWIDALVQAACLVLLINLFLFQLYAIPSESMVPEFMIGDRVVVLKTPSGPKFPLSNVGIPRMRSYERGDIVVFNNPHYNDTKEARVRSFASQLVYMLTFTAVNINRDEYGAIKADPLVKRVVGMPGEKLMMVDGVLYAKRKDAPDFKLVSEDAVWAAWNIDALPRSERALVERIPLSREQFTLLESVESLRANADLHALGSEASALVDRFASLRHLEDTVLSAPELVSRNAREVYALFSSDADITRLLLTTNGGLSWFRDFMTGWTVNSSRDTLFEDRSFRLNVLIKLCFGRLVVRNAELFASNTTLDAFRNDHERTQILSEAQTYLHYLAQHDQRNMGEFPEAEDEYIPDNCFFMMGDNRFNSLDMRHSYTIRLAALDPDDAYSVLYRSNLGPQYVPVSRILGVASFRFWPLSRLGIPE